MTLGVAWKDVGLAMKPNRCDPRTDMKDGLANCSFFVLMCIKGSISQWSGL